MCSIHHLLRVSLAGCLWLALCCPARADLILGGFSHLEWDRALEPGSSPARTITIDINGPGNNSLNDFNLGFRFVPTDGAVGSLAIGGASVPETNPAFSPFRSTDPIIEPITNVWVVTAGKDGADATIMQMRNLIDFTLNSPGNDALGLFEVYLVPEFTSFYNSSTFDQAYFANVPENGPDVFIGTVNVTAVPEPSSLAMIGAVACSYGLVRRRRRKKRAAALEADSEPVA